MSRLAPIKEKVPEISWDHLRIMVALIKRKYGLFGEDTEVNYCKSLFKTEFPTIKLNLK